MQILNVLDNLLQACRDGEAAAVRALPEEQVEVRDPVSKTGGEIALAHGQLIVVAKHSKIQLVIDNHKAVTSF